MREQRQESGRILSCQRTEVIVGMYKVSVLSSFLCAFVADAVIKFARGFAK